MEEVDKMPDHRKSLLIGITEGLKKLAPPVVHRGESRGISKEEISVRRILLPFGKFLYSSYTETHRITFHRDGEKTHIHRSVMLTESPRLKLSPVVISIFACVALFITALTVMGTAAKNVQGRAPHSSHSLETPPMDYRLADGIGSPRDGGDPTGELTEYYRLLDGDEFFEAYHRQSGRVKNKMSYGEFLTMWEPNEAVKVDGIKLLSKTRSEARVQVRLTADDPDGNGRITAERWIGMVHMVRDDNAWRYDGGDFHRD